MTPTNPSRPNLLILMLCAPHHREEQELYRNVWKNRLPSHVRMWFVEGQNGDSGVEELRDDVLHVPCAEAYENLAKKVSLAIRYFVRASSCSYLFKCDVNTYVNIDRLAAYPYEGRDYVGAVVARGCYDPCWHFGKCLSASWNSRPHTSVYRGPFAAGGVGYFLSRSSAILIAEHGSDLAAQELSYEDKMVGDILRVHNIECFDDPESFDLRRIKFVDNPRLITRKTRNAAQLREFFETKGL